jgi:hypothetical protein
MSSPGGKPRLEPYDVREQQHYEGGEDMSGMLGAIVQLVIGLVIGTVMFLVMQPLI